MWKNKLFFVYTVLMVPALLDAQRSPTISYISQEQIKDIGGSVDFSCSIQYAEDYPVYWTKIDRSKSVEPVPISAGTSPILKDSRFNVRFLPETSSYVLHIQDLQETDAGFYTCMIAISSARKVMAEVELQIRRPPIIFDNSTRAVVTTEGSSVKLECYAGGHPAPTISWKRDNNVILPTGTSIFRGNTLVIPSVNKDHHGIYYCVAENGVGHGMRRNIDVEVQFAPVVNATRKRVGQALQYDMDLECKVEAYPPPAIIWIKDGMQLVNNQHYEISHSITSDQVTSTVVRIITIEKRQFGSYTCRATNIFGESEAKIDLFETIIPMCPPACGGQNN